VWALWALAVASLAAASALTAARGGSTHPATVLDRGILVTGYASVGLALCLRVPRNAIGWLFLAFGVIGGVAAVCDAYADPRLGLPWSSAAAVAAGLLDPFPLFVLPVLLLVFPSGRLPSARWRPLAFVWGAGLAAYLLAAVFWPGPLGLDSDPSLRNPIGIGGGLGGLIVIVGITALATSLIAVIVAAVSLVVRFRRASGVLRQQLKWFGTAAAGIAVSIPLDVALSSSGSPLASAISTVILPVAATGLLVATGVAVLRYRLYEIDVLIRKTLVYALLVGSLAAVYLGGISLIGGALDAVTGTSGALAVTVSTLAVAAAFQPLRTRIQRTIDQRFYRQKYDANVTLEAFGARLRDQIDLAALHSEVLSVVNATVQPSHTSLWIRPTVAGAAPAPLRPTR
jgi:hypothetical protein